MKKLFIAATLALFIAGCAGGGITGKGPIVNPITSVDMYRVKNVYAATLQLASDWRDYCFARSYDVLMADPIAAPICTNRRNRLRTIQSAQSKAGSAVRYASNWVAAHPTLDLSAVVGPAWDAVGQFESTRTEGELAMTDTTVIPAEPEKSTFEKFADAANTALNVVKTLADTPGINLLPYASIISSAISAIQAAYKVGVNVIPYINALKDTFKDGNVPSQAQMDALDAKIAELEARIQAPLPAADVGEPD